MIIVGAQGFAKEVLQIVSVELEYKDEDILFFDNVNKDIADKLFNRFKVLKSISEVEHYIANAKDKTFTLGLGNPKARFKLYKQFIDLGAIPKTIISTKAEIGSFNVTIGECSTIMSGAKISNGVNIGMGSLIYYNTIITHDSQLGDFVEISPNATILGRCRVESMSSIGSGAILLPDICIDKNVIVGAGSVVTKNIPANSTVVGVPGRILSKNKV